MEVQSINYNYETAIINDFPIKAKTNWIFVRGFSKDTQKIDVELYFGSFGQISLHIFNFRTNDKMNVGYSFIAMKDHRVSEFILKNNHAIKYTRVSCRWAKKNEIEKYKNMEDNPSASKKLYISGIEDDYDKDLFTEYFETYGPIKYIYLLKKRSDGKKLSGYVQFYNKEVALYCFIQENEIKNLPYKVRRFPEVPNNVPISNLSNTQLTCTSLQANFLDHDITSHRSLNNAGQGEQGSARSLRNINDNDKISGSRKNCRNTRVRGIRTKSSDKEQNFNDSSAVKDCNRNLWVQLEKKGIVIEPYDEECFEPYYICDDLEYDFLKENFNIAKNKVCKVSYQLDLKDDSKLNEFGTKVLREEMITNLISNQLQNKSPEKEKPGNSKSNLINNNESSTVSKNSNLDQVECNMNDCTQNISPYPDSNNMLQNDDVIAFSLAYYKEIKEVHLNLEQNIVSIPKTTRL